MRANTSLSCNPFEGNRWEDDSVNIIYLPEIFSELEKKHDLYLVGSRGTGKTTFLQALNWDTRLKNSSIHMQIEKQDLFHNKYVGIYINAMSFGDSIFEEKYTSDDPIMRLYSLWAELNVLHRVLESIQGLYGSGYIDFTIEHEQSKCNKIYDYLFNQLGSLILKERRNTKIDYNITLLSEVIASLPKKVIDERIKLSHMYETYSFGNLLKETVTNLMILCDGQDKSEWYTKVCFDQIESAPNFQKIANTLVVKKLSNKVWFIVSGLINRNIDINQTYIPNHNLTGDDRKYIDLDLEFFSSDSVKQKSFYSLAEGICELRLKHADSTIGEDKKFDLATHLGTWDIREILDVFLRQKETISVSDEFKQFMNLVREKHKEKEYLTTHPPYIETYYYDVLKYDKKWDGDLEKSRQKNSTTGKKYVVIMLSLLRHYKFQSSTPYVGKRQIMSLCNTTREFLKLMKALFDVRMQRSSSKDIESFFSYEANLTQNEIEVQTEAALNAANEKYPNIGTNLGDKAKERMRYFIDTCGNLLYDLQAKEELSSLMSDEKGVFSVSFKDDKDGKAMYKFLKTADEDTYIKILSESTEDDEKTVDFELNKLFAAKYKFSFRKSRNKIMLNGNLLQNLCVRKNNSLDQATKILIEDVENNYDLKLNGENNISKRKKGTKRKKSTTQRMLY